MQDYQKLYTLLFNACTDAVEAIDEMNFGQAKDILIRAQQQAEERYLDEAEAQMPGSLPDETINLKQA